MNIINIDQNFVDIFFTFSEETQGGSIEVSRKLWKQNQPCSLAKNNIYLG